MKWTERAQVCCFYYHPELGKKNLAFTSLVYNLNPRTVEGWCTKSSMIRIWREMAKGITVSHILSGLSERWRDCKGFQSISKDALVSPIPDKYLPDVTKAYFWKQALFDGSGYVMLQKKVAIASIYPESYFFICKGQKRAFVLTRKPSKYDVEKI